MSPQATEPLLEPHAEESKADNRGRRIAIVGVLVCTSWFAGYTAGISPAAQGLSEADQVRFRGTNATTSLSLLTLDESCYGFTGGTCNINDCAASRHAECTNNNQCMCPHGFCTGADGSCYKGNYKLVAGGVSLENVYWPGYWLYFQSASLLNQLKVSNWPKETFAGRQLFDIYELPGSVSGKKQYFLASHTYKNWVASIRSTGSVLSLSASLWGLYALNLEHTIAPWDPQKLIVQICSMKDAKGGAYKDAVMIGSPGAMGRPNWAYIHSGSSLVYGTTIATDPGTGGYWNPSATIEGLQIC